MEQITECPSCASCRRVSITFSAWKASSPERTTVNFVNKKKKKKFFFTSFTGTNRIAFLSMTYTITKLAEHCDYNLELP